jgi:hypothetical protein
VYFQPNRAQFALAADPRLLFSAFILLAYCAASLTSQMNHLVMGANEFNLLLSIFYNKA